MPIQPEFPGLRDAMKKKKQTWRETAEMAPLKPLNRPQTTRLTPSGTIKQ